MDARKAKGSKGSHRKFNEIVQGSNRMQTFAKFAVSCGDLRGCLLIDMSYWKTEYLA